MASRISNRIGLEVQEHVVHIFYDERINRHRCRFIRNAPARRVAVPTIQEAIPNLFEDPSQVRSVFSNRVSRVAARDH
jgi:hypothetical protein